MCVCTLACVSFLALYQITAMYLKYQHTLDEVCNIINIMSPVRGKTTTNLFSYNLVLFTWTNAYNI